MRATSGSRATESGLRCGGWASAGKKTLGYRERDPHKRRAYLRLRERYRRRGKTLVYVDESGFAPTVTRRYAYAPQGQRVYGLQSGERRPRTSLLAARSGSTFAAPLRFDGSCNTALFNAWVAHELGPLLDARHVVILDNAAFPKSAATQTLLSRTGATVLFLPPYSPDLNPIEQDFATLKKLWEYDEHTSLERLLQTYKWPGA